MGLTLITPPRGEPLYLDEVLAHLRVEHHEDDGLITALITTARLSAEAETHRALVTQSWRKTLDSWPADGEIELPRPPLQSVQEISYLDSDGARQIVDAADYQVVTDELVGRVQPAYGKSWPAARLVPGSIRVDYTCGYGLAEDIPQSIKAWMLLAIGTWYAQREVVLAGVSVAELPTAFWGGLLDAFRIHEL